MKAYIITIGDEILLGQILDTNSRYIAKALAGLGIETAKMLSVSDKRTEILNALKEAFSCADLILVTGGLGPTKDDITKTVLAEFFGAKLVFNQQAYDWVCGYFSNKNCKLNAYNQTQAVLPDNCTPLHNAKGTACGMWFEKDSKVLVSMAGVPFEMEHLMQTEVLPKIKHFFKCGELSYKMLGVYDIAESDLAIKLADFEAALPQGLGLAYLPASGFIRLRLTAKGTAQTLLAEQFDKLQTALNGLKYNIIKDENDAEELLCKISKLGTLSVAESCTGGNISAMITARAGASKYYLGGITAYSNEVKAAVLGVSRKDLEQFGAVSEQVALQMAQGVRKLTGADWGIATTGIAGPEGGTPQKPVGTVWIAVSGAKGSRAEKFVFSTVRERNIGKASVKALEMLLSFAQEK